MTGPSYRDVWPTTYDWEELREQIDRFGREGFRPDRFYASTTDGGAICQGDVVQFTADLPFLDETGCPVAEGTFDLWLVAGNTCDFERADTEVQCSLLLPVVVVAPETVPEGKLQAIRSYGTYRTFYLPPWDDALSAGAIADFERFVTVDKRHLRNVKVVARLSFHGWIVLHSCLVRFLARGDGRFDEPSAPPL